MIFLDKLDSIMEALRTRLSESGKGKKSRVYIFLLDNMEYFCDGTQTLLYNLFDACASGQVSCVVIANFKGFVVANQKLYFFTGMSRSGWYYE